MLTLLIVYLNNMYVRKQQTRSPPNTTALKPTLNVTDAPEHAAMLTNAGQQTLAHRRAAHFSHGMLRQTPELTHFASRMATFNERHGDSTPTPLLLKQPQPPSLGLSTLGEKLSWPITAPVNLFGN